MTTIQLTDAEMMVIQMMRLPPADKCEHRTMRFVLPLSDKEVYDITAVPRRKSFRTYTVDKIGISMHGKVQKTWALSTQQGILIAPINAIFK